MKRAFSLFLCILLASLSATAARADDDKVSMTYTVFGGWGFWSSGKNIPFGYSNGASFAKHVYLGAGLTGVLGLSKKTADGANVTYDNGIYVSADGGYEQIVDDHLYVRGTLSLGSLIWLHNEGTDYQSAQVTARKTRLGVAPSFLIGALAGPVIIGVQTRAIVAVGDPGVSSFGLGLVVGGRFSL